MTEDEREPLEEARDSLLAAEMLLTGGYPGYAASRAAACRGIGWALESEGPG